MKHVIKKLKSINGGIATANITGLPAKIMFCDYALFFVKWSGGVRGTVSFEVSLSDETKEIEWYPLDDVSYPITSDSGTVEINLERLCHGLIRPVFTFSSGTGLISVSINAKSIGG